MPNVIVDEDSIQRHYEYLVDPTLDGRSAKDYAVTTPQMDSIHYFHGDRGLRFCLEFFHSTCSSKLL